MRVLCFIILLTAIGCTNNSEKSISINNVTTNEDSLKNAIIQKGDISAYQTLWYLYLDSSKPEEYLNYSLIMANKYDYTDAYFNVYRCLINLYPNKEMLDKLTVDIAIKYLQMAAAKKHQQALEILGDYYIKGKFVEKDVTLGRKLLNESTKESNGNESNLALPK